MVRAQRPPPTTDIFMAIALALDIEFGSLYPALKRLELKGWIAAKWETSEHNRRVKHYRLTPAGRKQLRREHSRWADFVSAIGQIMGPFPHGGK